MVVVLANRSCVKYVLMMVCQTVCAHDILLSTTCIDLYLHDNKNLWARLALMNFWTESYKEYKI